MRFKTEWPGKCADNRFSVQDMNLLEQLRDNIKMIADSRETPSKTALALELALMQSYLAENGQSSNNRDAKE